MQFLSSQPSSQTIQVASQVRPTADIQTAEPPSPFFAITGMYDAQFMD